jgi:WXG100 family type VII secretion target
MPAGSIRVTSADLEAVSKQLQSGAASINDQASQLKSAVDNLLANGWQSTAAGQFETMYNEWNQSATGLNNALTGISQLLQNAAQAYDQTEEAIAKSMRSS